MRWSKRTAASLLTLISVLALGTPTALAAGAPIIVPGEVWTSSVAASTAHLNAKINPNGLATGYHFDYITKAAYDANVSAAKDPFTGTARIPASSDANIGSGESDLKVSQTPSLLSPGTTYRYRLVAHNSSGTTETSPPLTFTTRAIVGSILPDSRGWEMVSPVDKNGGQVDPPGAIAGGGVLQAAGGGGLVTYGSSASFGPGAQGAPPASQYVATRGSGGWATQNVTVPLFSGSYGTQDQGVPYQLFSPDLARALLLNGDHCRGEATGCAVANPPLAGTDAPAGYQNYYLRDSATAGFTALLGSSAVGTLDLEPADFDLSLAGASPDLLHGVISTCAALTPDATEVPLGEGCDASKPNLYEYSSGGALSLINTTPGAKLAAQSGAVSANGLRVYWSDLAGNLYLREGALNEPVGAGTFQTASANGATAFHIDSSNHLQSYNAITHTSTDLTPGGGVLGVLGASEDGTYVYYKDAGGLKLWHSGTTTPVAPSADAGNYPPTTGTARVSADGIHLLFVSTVSLTEYDNKDQGTGNPDSEIYLYDATGSGSLTCVSCNPTNERPIGPSTIPGAITNGTAPGSTHSYKPRALSADGRRVFFESGDALAVKDNNSGGTDVYQWEAQGEGDCARVGGCVSLISSGAAGGAAFVDASADGADIFFLTDDSLVHSDPGGVDLYDARGGGGFPEPPAPIACEGDNCQPLPSQPADRTLATTIPGLGNPPVHYQKFHHHKRHKKQRKRHQKRQQRMHHQRKAGQ